MQEELERVILDMVVVETTSVCLMIQSTYKHTHLEYRGTAMCMAQNMHYLLYLDV